MPRPNTTSQQRRRLAPILATTFAQQGYRRATTAVLAKRCGVQETILYRLWPSKKAMFVAAIQYVYESCLQTWTAVLHDTASPKQQPNGKRAAGKGAVGNPAGGNLPGALPGAALLPGALPGAGGGDPAVLLLDYESAHIGEFGLYRIVFAGLSETDDPEIRQALVHMYRRFHQFLRRQIAAHRGRSTQDASLAAWAMIGLGTLSNVSRELNLMSDRHRRQMVKRIGELLLTG